MYLCAFQCLATGSWSFYFLKYFEKTGIIASSAGIQFELEKGIQEIDEKLKKIEAERNKSTTVSVRLENALPNKPGDQ